MSDRSIAAIAYAIVALGCVGAGLVVGNYGDAWDLLRQGSPARAAALYTIGSFVGSSLLSALLFAPLELPQAARTALLLAGILICVVGLVFAQVIALFWLSAIAAAYRFHRS